MPKLLINVTRIIVRICIILTLSTMATVASSEGLGIGQFKGDACLTLNSFQKLDDSNLRSSSQDFAAMSRYVEDQQQLVGIHNNCCTGLMQLNYVNLQNPNICGCTAAEYGAYTQQQQIDVYQNYFHTLNADYGMNQLKQMIAGHQTLGGHVVDGYTLVACAQMGTGNCDAAVRNACSSVAIGEGGDTHVNVCTMGDKARAAMASYNIFSTCAPPG